MTRTEFKAFIETEVCPRWPRWTPVRVTLDDWWKLLGKVSVNQARTAIQQHKMSDGAIVAEPRLSCVRAFLVVTPSDCPKPKTKVPTKPLNGSGWRQVLREIAAGPDSPASRFARDFLQRKDVMAMPKSEPPKCASKQQIDRLFTVPESGAGPFPADFDNDPALQESEPDE